MPWLRYCDLRSCHDTLLTAKIAEPLTQRQNVIGDGHERTVSGSCTGPPRKCPQHLWRRPIPSSVPALPSPLPKVPMAHPAPSGSPSPLWPAALVLACVATIAALATAVIAGVGGPSAGTVAAAVTAAVAALSASGAVAVLKRRGRSAAASSAGHHTHEMERLDADWRSHSEAQTTALASIHAAAKHLVEARLPAALDGTSVPAAAGAQPIDPAWSELFEQAVAHATDTAKQSREDQESLRLLVVSLARRVQASAHRIQAESEQMAARHPGDADVLRVSMSVDHAAAQQGRLAQSLAVLCGERPGQQWPEPLALVDVVRAGSARIVPFERVEVSGDPDVAVAAPAVEALIHLVAELLANAAQSSPPATKVLVTVRTVQRGAVVEIDDGGLGMDEQRLERARAAVAADRPIGLGELGESPQTGLAVVGSYCRRYGFRTDVSESPYGGVRAVVLIPTDLMEIVEPAGTVPAHVGPGDEPAPPEPRSAGLPQRTSRRGAGLPSAGAPPAPEVTPEVAPEPSPTDAGDWMSAFVAGGTESAEDTEDTEEGPR